MSNNAPIPNKILQVNKQWFETMKAYLDNMPKDSDGNSRFDSEQFDRLQRAYGGSELPMPNDDAINKLTNEN